MWAAKRGHRVALAFAALILATPSSQAQLRLTPGDIPHSAIEAPTAQGVPRAQPPKSERKKSAKKPAETTETASTEAAAPVTTGNFPRRLPQLEIKTRFFNGEPITSRGRGSANLFTLIFTKDGTIQRTDAKGDKVLGRWKFLGDAYCSRWTGEKKDTCYTVVEDGEIIKVVFFTRAVATWSRNGTPPPP